MGNFTKLSKSTNHYTSLYGFILGFKKKQCHKNKRGHACQTTKSCAGIKNFGKVNIIFVSYFS